MWIERLAVAGALVLAGCGDDVGSDADTQSSTVPETSGSNDQSGDGDGDGDPGDGDPGDGDGDGDPGDGDGDPGDGDGDGDPGVKFDMAPLPDETGGEGCMGMGGGEDVEFSYIWVANSSEGTLSKINTETLVEEARYITRPDHAGRPSRTSVNLSGDVAVASRDGGISKFLARLDDCAEQNGMPDIQTSTGKNDVVAWDLEECRAWYTEFVGQNLANRPVAWTAGVFDQGSCTWVDQKLWTQTALLGQANSMQIHRLDGETGAIEDTVPAPNVDLGSWGAYGGAVDGEDNFWFSTHGSGSPPTLSRVDNDTLVLTTWPVPNGLSPYGMTVDSEGHAWVAGYSGGTARFTPDSETWDVVNVTGLGMQADSDGRVWVGTYGGQGSGVTSIDVNTLEILDFIPLPNAGVTKGVSIDFYGYVWIVNMASSAYRVDPDTHMFQSYDGLNGAYTYSDMTGAGLKNVAFPQG
ncbi:Vgb family protein [Enhygromyxa salina]|uniref:Virginiamycin B lyase n=1 Tax=Enhygromyxa salina TaxID=215803 RepID=A0A2S9YSJ9_9BACT|nr:two-component regulator propeller domain-containing protein [Enhygromyxa salina]PRQ08063.1 Virginiamycin B lyase [Enhygromyxa salina]